MGLFTSRRVPSRLFAPQRLVGKSEALVAAAQQVSGKEAQKYRRLLQPWQRQALEFYDKLGECWYPAQFYARMLSKVRLYPGRRLPNGEVEEVDDEDVQEILARIQDPGGGQSQWKSSYGRLQFLIGDGHLTVTKEDSEERWEYLSPAELIPTGDGKFERIAGSTGERVIYREAPDNAEELTNGQIRTWRLWNRHPMRSEWADAPVRAVLPLFEYLMLLGQAARAQALSRVAGTGILVIADEITLPGYDAEADDSDANSDPFTKKLTEYVVKPITEPGSAAQVAPLVARIEVGERSIDDLIKLIQIHDPNQTGDWQERIDRTIKRIALGLDMPPEFFLGLADANHWTAWLISAQVFAGHGEPVTIRLCDDLTSSYFRPACVAAGIGDAEELLVWYDAAQVVVNPDRGKDADAAWDRGVIGGKALRAAHDFAESDAPNSEEHAEWVAVKTRFAGRPKDAPQEPVSGTGSDAPAGEPSENGRSGPRTAEPSPANEGQAAVLGAAVLALERIRELAGARLRQKKMSCDGCFRGLEDVPNRGLVAAAGQEVVRAVGITSERAMVSGGAELFRDLLIRWGITSERAGILAGILEEHAAATLYEADPALPVQLLSEVNELEEVRAA